MGKGIYMNQIVDHHKYMHSQKFLPVLPPALIGEIFSWRVVVSCVTTTFRYHGNLHHIDEKFEYFYDARVH